MQKIISKYGRYAAVLVGLALILPILSAANNQMPMPEAKADIQSDEQDERIAADISNMTGVEKEKILALKKDGKTWNQLLEQLTGENAAGGQGDKEKRNDFLARDTIGEEAAARLREEGFTDDEIMQATLPVERVIFQLQDITSDMGQQREIPKPEVEPPSSAVNTPREDSSAYAELLNKIDVNTAVSLMLRLEQAFGSVEKVLDEYLYALQIGINLEQYMTDQKEYHKQKQEKSMGIDLQTIITIAKIEEKMLEKMRQINEKEEDPQLKIETTPAVHKPEAPNPLPDVPNPKAEDIKPQNPAEQIMNEIKAINPMENE